MKRILIVDDESAICQLLDRFLSKHNFHVSTTLLGKSGLSLLEKEPFDLVLSDFRLPDIDGLAFLKAAKALRPDCKVIIITGYSDIRMAVEVMKYGAIDYITKPLYPEELLSTVREVLAKEGHAKVPAGGQTTPGSTPEKPSRAGSAASGKDVYQLGESESSVMVQNSIALVAPTPMSVVIQGETGTGKEFAARRIHELSNRSGGAFVAIDCGALPKDIAGSEFFGHEQGAFTGAVKAKDGKFKLADGGTLFLDEIGNLSYEIQLKLLRVLQEQRFTRIGGNKDYEVDVRILTASNESLKEAVAEGRFREDLYFRLNEFSIHLAPLRERPEDLSAFASRFIAQANALLGRNVKKISPEVWARFRAYHWPGNLRELRNVIKRCVLLTQGETIELNCLPEEIIFAESTGNLPQSGEASSLKEAAEVAERDKIAKVLAQTGNNKSKAARLLNIDRKTLYNKLKTYGL